MQPEINGQLIQFLNNQMNKFMEIERVAKLVKWFIFLALITAAIVTVKFYLLKVNPIPVKVFVVKKGSVDATVTSTTSGTVKAKKDAKVSSEYTGRVVKIFYDEGDRASAGDVVVQLYDEELKAQLRLAEANVAVAESQVEQAKLRLKKAEDDYVRAASLREGDVVSKERYEAALSKRDIAKEAVNTALANLEQLKAAKEVARVNLSKTQIRAPFSGVISRMMAKEGESLTGGTLAITHVFEIVDDSEMEVEATVDEVDVGRLKLGQPVRVTLDAYPDKTFYGELTEISPVVSTNKEQNRTVDIKVKLRNNNSELRAQSEPYSANHSETDLLKVGMSADVEIIVDSREDVLFVPTYAIMEKNEKKIVYIVEDGKVKERTIKTGLGNWDTTQVTSGLRVGDEVIISLDIKELKEGIEVEVASKE